MPRLPAALVLVLAAAALGGCGGQKGPAPPAPTTTAAAPAGSTVSTPASFPFRATLTAPTNTPKVNVKWRYTVRVTDRTGKPIAARITVQMVDPLNQPHPVEYDDTTRNIINWPVTGLFRDFIIYPPESRGVPLRFRVIVRAKGRVARLTYLVTPR